MKQRIFLSGPTGAMGFPAMKALLEDIDEIELVVLARPSEKNKKILKPFSGIAGLTVVWGELTNYDDLKTCVKNADIALHVGALVSPNADYHPELTMQTNYGSMVNIIRAVKELNQTEKTHLVFIGTVAQAGERTPPIHWGRTGDPIKPAILDYYAVSKTAAERYMIESGIKYWTSLRQTGIIGPVMVKINDAIMFHNGLDNVLEYVSDRDSAALLRNLCRKERHGLLDGNFWGNIFNIGGGESCRISTFDFYKKLFGLIGIKKLSHVMDSKWSALRNFHGQYYLDSDKLNNILSFRSDSLEYLYKVFLDSQGAAAAASKILTKLPGFQKIIGSVIKKRFHKLTKGENGTVRFIENNMEELIDVYWGSKEAYQAIPRIDDFIPFSDFDKVIHIEHGYDEQKNEADLNLSDVKEAAKFRGGQCLSSDMKTGNWTEKLKFRCAFNHDFEASPLLILKGGHWCSVCERESWNYHERAKADPFFAQVWYPLHNKNEKSRVYKKLYAGML